MGNPSDVLSGQRIIPPGEFAERYSRLESKQRRALSAFLEAAESLDVAERSERRGRLERAARAIDAARNRKTGHSKPF